MNDHPSFDLWAEPWIPVEEPDGGLRRLSLQATLTDAHALRGFYDPSPLVVVALHRLLVAVLQEIIAPKRDDDLLDIWAAGRFSADAVEQFGRMHGDRFDLFDDAAPFLQSADIPLTPQKWGKGKSVGYLLPEHTAGTAVTHYLHLYDDAQLLCSRCAAKGLLLIPPFASSGGAGIKPSINGVPPIYVMPGGRTLFEMLAASLTTPAYQPAIRRATDDRPWWRRETPTIVERGVELLSVGYLESLTFPARRVRLHPRPMRRPCSRCGEHTPWGVPEMTYEMGECRPKTAAWWQDPFAAYRLRPKADQPIPIRPVEGRAAWREFGGLFLPHAARSRGDTGGTLLHRPRIIDQLEALRTEAEGRRALPYGEDLSIPFQTIGLRTDMKMKIFEWEQSGFQVPPRLLTDLHAAERVENAVDYARLVEGRLRLAFREHYGGDGGEEKNQTTRQRLLQAYWTRLAPRFQSFVVHAAAEPTAAYYQWLDDTADHARAVFREHVETLGSNAIALRQRVEAINHCAALLNKLQQKMMEGIIV